MDQQNEELFFRKYKSNFKNISQTTKKLEESQAYKIRYEKRRYCTQRNLGNVMNNNISANWKTQKKWISF